MSLPEIKAKDPDLEKLYRLLLSLWLTFCIFGLIWFFTKVIQGRQTVRHNFYSIGEHLKRMQEVLDEREKAMETEENGISEGGTTTTTTKSETETDDNADNFKQEDEEKETDEAKEENENDENQEVDLDISVDNNISRHRKAIREPREDDNGVRHGIEDITVQVTDVKEKTT